MTQAIRMKFEKHYAHEIYNKQSSQDTNVAWEITENHGTQLAGTHGHSPRSMLLITLLSITNQTASNLRLEEIRIRMIVRL